MISTKMAANRQMSEEYEAIVFTDGVYNGKNGRQFAVDNAGEGIIVMECPVTGLNVSVPVPDYNVGVKYTKKVTEVGTTATNLIAVY